MMVDAVRRAAQGRPDIELLVLFGSTARGTAHAGSDLDLGVLLTCDTPSDRASTEFALARAASRTVDLVWLQDAPPQLRFEIAREGRVLLETATNAWADFRYHTMLDWWDWAPYARLIHAAAVRRLRDRLA